MVAVAVTRRRVLLAAVTGALLLAVAAVGAREGDDEPPAPAGTTASPVQRQTVAPGSFTGPARDPAGRPDRAARRRG